MDVAGRQAGGKRKQPAAPAAAAAATPRSVRKAPAGTIRNTLVLACPQSTSFQCASIVQGGSSWCSTFVPLSSICCVLIYTCRWPALLLAAAKPRGEKRKAEPVAAADDPDTDEGVYHTPTMLKFGIASDVDTFLHCGLQGSVFGHDALPHNHDERGQSGSSLQSQVLLKPEKFGPQAADADCMQAIRAASSSTRRHTPRRSTFHTVTAAHISRQSTADFRTLFTQAMP